MFSPVAIKSISCPASQKVASAEINQQGHDRGRENILPCDFPPFTTVPAYVSPSGLGQSQSQGKRTGLCRKLSSPKILYVLCGECHSVFALLSAFAWFSSEQIHSFVVNGKPVQEREKMCALLHHYHTAGTHTKSHVMGNALADRILLDDRVRDKLSESTWTTTALHYGLVYGSHGPMSDPR